MSTKIRIAALVAVVLLTTGARCGSSSDDVVRLLRGQADDAARIAAKVDDVSIVVRQASETDPAVLALRRIEAVATAAPVPDEIRGAYQALSWDATCAVVFGDVPGSVPELAAWLQNWAYRYSFSYLPGGSEQHASALLDELQPENAWSDAQEGCSAFGTFVIGVTSPT